MINKTAGVLSLFSISFSNSLFNTVSTLKSTNKITKTPTTDSPKWLKLTLLSSILAMTLATTGCSDMPGGDQQDSAQTEDGKDGEKKEKAPIPVEAVMVSRGDIQQTYRTITTLEAEEDAQVIARSTGLVQSILVEEGDIVTKGQLLAQLDIEQLTLEVQQIEATLNQLKNELTRQRSLFKRKLGSSDALDRARFEYQSQQAQHKLSKLKLNYASIKAPINGMVTERMIKAGNLIRDNDVLFQIIDLTTLKAVLHLPEKELGNVRKEQKVLLSVDAFEGQLIVGQIERIRPSIDTDTGTFKVIAQINNDNRLLKSGMFGKVEVVFDVHQNSLLMQQQAVITQDNRSHVFVVKDNKAMQTPVTIGFRRNGIVEIIEGLNEDDLVITTGQQILKHETKVEVVGETRQAVTDAQDQAEQTVVTATTASR